MYHRRLQSNIESYSKTFAVTAILTYLQCVKTKEFVQKMAGRCLAPGEGAAQFH